MSKVLKIQIILLTSSLVFTQTFTPLMSARFTFITNNQIQEIENETQNEGFSNFKIHGKNCFNQALPHSKIQELISNRKEVIFQFRSLDFPPLSPSFSGSLRRTTVLTNQIRYYISLPAIQLSLVLNFNGFHVYVKEI